MIIFNELEYAEQMNKQGFIKKFSIFELSIYAKWLRYLGKSKEVIEKELIVFSKRHCNEFNYQIHFDKIDKAMKSIEKYNLRLPIKTIITKSEWESICEIEDDRYRRILFVMLVVSKYYRINNTKINNNIKINIDNDKYCCWLSDIELCKLANVVFKPISGRDEMFGLLRDIGLVDIISKRNTYRYLTFVNDESEPFIEISDYNNIIWYYEREFGSKFGECKECGKLFKQNRKNNAEYCKEHRNYQKINKKNIICIDCGNKFEVDGKVKNKKRCLECQEKNNKERYIKYNKKRNI